MIISEKKDLAQDDNTSVSNNENEFQELDNEIEKVVRGETSYEEEKNDKNNVDLNNSQNTSQTSNNNRNNYYIGKTNNNSYFNNFEEEKKNVKNFQSSKQPEPNEVKSLNISKKCVSNSNMNPQNTFLQNISINFNKNYQNNFCNNMNENNSCNDMNNKYNSNNNQQFNLNKNNNNINELIYNNMNNFINNNINNFKLYNFINNMNKNQNNNNFDTLNVLNTNNNQLFSNINNCLYFPQFPLNDPNNNMSKNMVINNQIFTPININLQFTNNDMNQNCKLLNNFIKNSLSINGFNDTINDHFSHNINMNNNINQQFGIFPFNNIYPNINYQNKINIESMHKNYLNKNNNNFMHFFVNNNVNNNSNNNQTLNNNNNNSNNNHHNNILMNNNNDKQNNKNHEKNGNSNASTKRKIFNPLSDSEKEKNIINLMDIFQCKDMRTTLMIKNIPNKYTISSFLEEINENFKNTYDIFYLPIDYINKCNLGFAFINFLEPLHIILFYELYRGKKWKKFNSDKICELLYAKFQGRKELITHFEKGKVLTFDTEDKRPLILPVPHHFPKINLPCYYLEFFIKLYPYISYKIKNNISKNNNSISKIFSINGNFHKIKK